MNSSSELNGLIPIEKAPAELENKFSTGQIRWLFRNRKKNGFGDAFVMVTRKIYIRKDNFIQAVLALK